MANTAAIKPTLAQAKAALDKMDTDKNGRVSQAEYVNAMRLQYGFSEADLKGAFKLLDTNKDGTCPPQSTWPSFNVRRHALAETHAARPP